MATISGPRYPTASAPYNDVTFYDVAESELPHVDNSGTPDYYLKLDFTISFLTLTKAMQYKVYPQCVNENGTNKVVYYIAYHQDRGHNEFVVGPGKLDIF